MEQQEVKKLTGNARWVKRIMSEVIAFVLVLVLLLGCEAKLEYSVDGQRHELVLNPIAEPKP